jgi:hypothetical protein
MKLPVYSDGSSAKDLVHPRAYMTKDQALRYANRTIPRQLKRLGFVGYVFVSDPIIHGERYYRVTYGKEC